MLLQQVRGDVWDIIPGMAVQTLLQPLLIKIVTWGNKIIIIQYFPRLPSNPRNPHTIVIKLLHTNKSHCLPKYKEKPLSDPWPMSTYSRHSSLHSSRATKVKRQSIRSKYCHNRSLIVWMLNPLCLKRSTKFNDTAITPSTSLMITTHRSGLLSYKKNIDHIWDSQKTHTFQN